MTWAIVQRTKLPTAIVFTRVPPGERARVLRLGQGLLDQLGIAYRPTPLTYTLSYPYAGRGADRPGARAYEQGPRRGRRGLELDEAREDILIWRCAIASTCDAMMLFLPAGREPNLRLGSPRGGSCRLLALKAAEKVFRSLFPAGRSAK